MILFTKGGPQWLEFMADTGCDAFGLDWTCDIGKARVRVGDAGNVQSNANPSVQSAAPKRIRAEVKTALASYGHVFNLGHGYTHRYQSRPRAGTG